jgi:hypothetical protein
MTQEALKLALEALESCDSGHISDGGKQWFDEKLVDKAITAIKKALAQTQEPVGDEWTPCMKLPVVVHVRKQRLGEAHISTREGITPVKPDDLIMRGVSGEEYPIGRAIFEQTYSLDTTPPQRTERCNYPDCKCPTENPCLKGLAQPTKPLTDQTIETKAANLENATSDVKWGFEQGAKWAREML